MHLLELILNHQVSADNFWKQFGPRKARKSVSPDLDSSSQSDGMNS